MLLDDLPAGFPCIKTAVLIPVITEKDSNGNDVSFEKFRGKVVYGVNVASKCGYTASGYNLLAKIAAMKDQGVEVALFPCNQFGGQVLYTFYISHIYMLGQSLNSLSWYD